LSTKLYFIVYSSKGQQKLGLRKRQNG